MRAKKGQAVGEHSYDWVANHSATLAITRESNPAQYSPKATYYLMVHYQAPLS